jgi:hypothetical protein
VAPPSWAELLHQSLDHYQGIDIAQLLVAECARQRADQLKAIALPPPVCVVSLGIWGSIGLGVYGSRIACLEPGREGMGNTSLRKDVRGLTFSAVIPALVIQPEVSTRRNDN